MRIASFTRAIRERSREKYFPYRVETRQRVCDRFAARTDDWNCNVVRGAWRRSKSAIRIPCPRFRQIGRESIGFFLFSRRTDFTERKATHFTDRDRIVQVRKKRSRVICRETITCFNTFAAFSSIQNRWFSLKIQIFQKNIHDILNGCFLPYARYIIFIRDLIDRIWTRALRENGVLNGPPMSNNWPMSYYGWYFIVFYRIILSTRIINHGHTEQYTHTHAHIFIYIYIWQIFTNA